MKKIFLLFSVILFFVLLPLKFSFGYSVDLNNISTSDDVYTYYFNDNRLGIQQIIDRDLAEFYKPTNEISFNLGIGNEYNLNLPCTSTDTNYGTFFDYNGDNVGGGVGGSGLFCDNGTLHITSNWGTAEYIIVNKIRYYNNTETIDLAIVLLLEQIENKVYVLNTDLETLALVDFPSGINWDNEYETRFLNYSFATSTINFSYLINPDELNCDTSLYCPSHIKMDWVNATNTNIFGNDFIALYDFTSETIFDVVIDDSVQNDYFDIPENIPDGLYTFSISFYSYPESIAFEKTNIYFDVDIENGLITNHLRGSIGNALAPESRYQDCNLTNIDGCIVNGLIFAFIPRETFMSEYYDLLIDGFSGIPPLNLFFGIHSKFLELSETEGTQQSAIVVDLGDNHFGEIVMFDPVEVKNSYNEIVNNETNESMTNIIWLFASITLFSLIFHALVMMS